MTDSGRIGLLGGTFDPFHEGHLAVARVARRALQLDTVRVIPAYVPPHRPITPLASAEHRFAMVALGISGEPGLRADDRELIARGASYTSNTLAHFREEGFSPSQLFFITGADAFAEIATWYAYPEVLDQAHFVVIARSGRPARSLRQALPALSARMHEVAADGVVSPVDVAQPAIWLIDAQTPMVSGTKIRSAVAAGESLDGLVPPLVAQHIQRHGLYGFTQPSESPAAGRMKAASELHEQESV